MSENNEPIFSVLNGGKGCPGDCWPTWQYGDDAYNGGTYQDCLDYADGDEEYCNGCFGYRDGQFIGDRYGIPC